MTIKNVISLFLFNCLLQAWSDDTVNKRHEYQFSFKGPMLVQKSGTIPFFEHGGHAIASDDSIRLTPSMINKQGWVWSKKRAELSGFEADFTFRVTGRGRIGADGLAFWYVNEKENGGRTMGGPAKWNGLALVFDSYDNDGLENNPAILGLVNDGTKEYTSQEDGRNLALAWCIKDYRNRPYPIKVHVSYYKKTLKVLTSQGMSIKQDDLSPCFEAHDVELPNQGYFGFTAATGDIADDHDVYKLEVHSIHDKDSSKDSSMSEAEKLKFEKEFEEYYASLRKAQEEYDKEHAGKLKYKDEGVESEAGRNLRQIWEEQSAMHKLMADIGSKLDSISARMQSGGTDGWAAPHDVTKKEDLESAKGEIVASMRDIRQILDGMKSSLLNAPNKEGGGNAMSMMQLSHEVRDGLNYIKENMGKGQERNTGESGVSTSEVSCTNCLSLSVFVVFAAVQVIIIVGYMTYQNNQDSAAKKFY